MSNLATIAQLKGPQAAAQVLAKSIKLKQLGPIGDELVELLDPQQKGQDGKPLPPEMAALVGENQQLKQQLQQAGQIIETKQVEAQADLQKSQSSDAVKAQIAERDAMIEAQKAEAAAQQAARELQLKAQELDLKAQELQLKAADLASKERMHAATLAQEKQLAELDAQIKLDVAHPGGAMVVGGRRRVKVIKALVKGLDGEIVGCEEIHEAMPDDEMMQ